MIKFGVQLWQEEFDSDGLKKAWREVEDMGFESAWIYDHFYPMSNQTSANILEPWTLLPSLAAETSTLRLGVLVTCNSYRLPSILAKIAASVDVLSNGRLEFGIGAGWYEKEYRAYGIPFPNLGVRLKQLSEAIEIVKRIWTQEKATFQGDYYTVKDVHSYPKPIQKPHPPIWIGGKNGKLLEITALHADYTNIASCSPDEFRRKLRILERQCLRVGRNFKDIKKTWHGSMIIVDKKDGLKREVPKAKESSTNEGIQKMDFDQYLDKVIAGTPDQCVEKIQRYVNLGAEYFIPHFPFAADLKALHLFMDKVAPEFRGA